jgi:hypothetical protein
MDYTQDPPTEVDAPTKKSKMLRFVMYLLLALVPHTAYFFTPKILLSGTAPDPQDHAIAILIEADRKARGDITFSFRDNDVRKVFVNGTQEGCSFLLMETLWRDCKGIHLGQTNATNAEAKSASIQADLLVARRPCASLHRLSNPDEKSRISKLLKCGTSTQFFFAGTPFYFDNHENRRVVLKQFQGVLQ